MGKFSASAIKGILLVLLFIFLKHSRKVKPHALSIRQLTRGLPLYSICPLQSYFSDPHSQFMMQLEAAQA